MSHYNALLLDFDSSFADKLDAILRGAGVHLHQAQQAKQGVTLARKIPPHLVLLDLDRPARQSIRFLCDLKKLGFHPKVLWLSASITQAGIARVLASGAQGLLSRDSDTVTIISAVQTILAGDSYFPPIHSAAPSSGARAAQESERILRLLEPYDTTGITEAS